MDEERTQWTEPAATQTLESPSANRQEEEGPTDEEERQKPAQFPPSEYAWDAVEPEEESEDARTGEKTDASAKALPFSQGSPLRAVIRAGMALLLLFAALLYATSAIDGISGLLSEGLGRLALGELYGGTDNIRSSTPLAKALPSTLLRPETALDLSSLPANEEEGGASSPSSAEGGDEKAPTDGATDGDTTGSTGTEGSGGAGAIPIVSADLSVQAANGLDVINETPYEVVLSPKSERAVPPLAALLEQYGADAPIVLILHTHTTESYAENGADTTSEGAFRSENPEENILSVGEAMADVLNAWGIRTLHCEKLLDAEDFNMAYYNASLEIRGYLTQYPSISYIFDLHRDSIPYGEGTIRPVTEIDGKAYAQAMFVVGTDYGGSGHTGWADNFNLACRVQAAVNTAHPGLMRAINLRAASFNEQYAKGSLLIEMGAVGSSLEEARETATLLGTFLAKEIIG